MLPAPLWLSLFFDGCICHFGFVFQNSVFQVAVVQVAVVQAAVPNRHCCYSLPGSYGGPTLLMLMAREAALPTLKWAWSMCGRISV